MSIRYWLGRVQPRAQVVTITVTAYDATTTYKVTMGVNVVSVLGSGGTTTTVATALLAALQATQYLEFSDVSWTSSTNVITGTAQTPGKPFTATSSVSGGAGTIGAVTTTTTNTSPNDVGDANNWSAATLPVTGDSIIVENSDVDMLWNLDSFAAADIAAFTRRATHTGKIALPAFNSSGYYEYRATKLSMQTCTALTIEQSPSDGLEHIKIGTGANASAWSIYGQGGGTTLGNEPLWLDGANNSNTLVCDGGSVAIAKLSSDTATLSSIKAVGGSTLNFGTGVTFSSATASLTNCTAYIQSAITTLTTDGNGSTIVTGTATVGTLTINSGKVTYISSGTCTTLTVLAPGAIDYSLDRRARTITNKVVLYEGATFNDPDATVTFGATPAFQVVQGRLAKCNVDLGVNRSYVVS